VAYRDRSEDEVRDIFVVRMGSTGWTEPQAVHRDGWRIDGCPVNGPAVDAVDGRVAVAWFTGAEPAPRVQIAFSDDSGKTFGEPVALDDGPVLGRTDVVLDEDGAAWVSWIANHNESAEILLQRVAPDGTENAPRVVAQTTTARSSGFPILEKAQGSLFVAWVDVGADPSLSRIRVREIR
jgi:hypothetical protein